MKRCINCMETMADELTVCPHCGYDAETTEERFDQLKPGSLLRERFTVGRPLGRGGFGITYIAWDNSLQRKVAIKEYLPKGMALRDQGNTTITYDAETKEAFLRGVEKTIEESRKLAGFTDLESVVNVYDCFKENGTAYIVMEVLKGENVKEKISREGPASFEETLRIMTPVLKTLGAVHKAGLIHRDISPDNIFICENGRIKLLDFGSARVADNSDERSRSIVLKHGYAPKEQYTSKGRQGPYTDIYAVCATIYKMLTGITPVDSLERIADEDELQDISELVKIPAPAAKAIMKGMSVNAADRIQSAEELLEKLSEKEDKRSSAFYDAEETVTLYVPGTKTTDIPEMPVMASEIKTSSSPLTNSKSKPESIPEKNKKASSKEKTDKPGTVKKIIATVAAVALVATGTVLISKVIKNTDGGEDESTTITDTISTSRTTAATSISELTSKITETVIRSDLSAVSIISFGSYPQSKVTDSSLINALDSIKKEWISYDYYIDGSASDFMKYQDIIYKGEKYRAVTFSKYRPYMTTAQSNTEFSMQDDNGYVPGEVYYFKYKPLRWRVLDSSKRLLICENLIDAQAFNNIVYLSGKEYYSNYSLSSYANSYIESSIRKWLNKDFYNTAFSSSEKNSIATASLDNNAYSSQYAIYSGESTRDNVFLLSYNDMKNTSYGFTSSDSKTASRMASGTDYAECQGLYAPNEYHTKSGNDTSNWILRTAGKKSDYLCYVRLAGSIYDYNFTINYTNYGIRPAITLKSD
ncbi:MAG: serine/threonine protein kinase [Clostridia bacterium]|nr:serine/threonine protein kinase [Clostridia bacterium]